MTCLLLLAFAMGTQVFLYFNPGAMSPDSFAILIQARTGIFEDGHPPLMAAIWRQIDGIVPGPIGMLVLHLALFYGGFYLIFRWGAQRYGYFIVPVFFVVGMSPPIIGILGAIWIDITMAGFFIMAIGLFLAGYANQKDSRRVMLLLSALVLATLGLAVRHNGAAGAFPLIAFFIFQSMRTQAEDSASACVRNWRRHCLHAPRLRWNETDLNMDGGCSEILLACWGDVRHCRYFISGEEVLVFR